MMESIKFTIEVDQELVNWANRNSDNPVALTHDSAIETLAYVFSRNWDVSIQDIEYYFKVKYKQP